MSDAVPNKLTPQQLDRLRARLDAALRAFVQTNGLPVYTVLSAGTVSAEGVEGRDRLLLTAHLEKLPVVEKE